MLEKYYNLERRAHLIRNSPEFVIFYSWITVTLFQVLFENRTSCELSKKIEQAHICYRKRGSKNII